MSVHLLALLALMMTQSIEIQFRIKPTKSLLDINPPIIEKALANIAQCPPYQIYDDRASDANFVTLVFTFKEDDLHRLPEVQKALLKMRKVCVYVMDQNRNMALIDDLSPAQIQQYAKIVMH
ncbi:MAG: hypothetical protein OHK0053_22930 [Microscillaceae bacterium]